MTTKLASINTKTMNPADEYGERKGTESNPEEGKVGAEDVESAMRIGGGRGRETAYMG